MTRKKEESEKIGNIAPFGLRMPPEMRAYIEKAAFENGRSMNAEILDRISDSMERDNLISQMYDRLEQVEREVEKHSEMLGDRRHIR